MTEGVNPLRQGLSNERIAEPCTVVIVGASGDLTKRKLVPALYTLGTEGMLPTSFAIVGFARKEISDEEFRTEMRAGCEKFARHRPVDEALWNTFGSGLYFQAGDYDDPKAWAALKERLEKIDKERGIPGNRVFYLATPPSIFPIALKHLGAAGLINRASDTPFTRVIIEKPFGTDLLSARALNKEAQAVLAEKQIYRIDHYLGKETVQNLMVLRFATGLFEPLWNNRFIDHVPITGAEAFGIEGRGGYFEQAGILRDMVQNHLFQVLAITAMEPPVSMSADDLRDEKVKVLKSLQPIPEGRLEDSVVCGQYREGTIGGKRQIGYREEPGVAKDSVRETYVALKIYLDNWRWAGVPFYLRSAKAMPRKVTEVAMVFKEAPLRLFGDKMPASQAPNVLAIRIQPDEGVSLRFGAKVPGNVMGILPVNMEFHYGTSFGAEPPEAYERLLHDCIVGDQALFTRADEVEASWKWISRIHGEIENRPNRTIATYEAGTWGPEEADRMQLRNGHQWRRP